MIRGEVRVTAHHSQRSTSRPFPATRTTVCRPARASLPRYAEDRANESLRCRHAVTPRTKRTKLWSHLGDRPTSIAEHVRRILAEPRRTSTTTSAFELVVHTQQLRKL